MINTEKFWSRVDKSGDCWIWTGRLANKYGHFYVGGGKYLRAHRVSWGLTNGPIPKGVHILHSCDNPPCVNPAHLRPGTHIINMKDQVDRGRHYQKEKKLCKHGHDDWTKDSRGDRRCRECNRQYFRNWYEKRA